MYCMATSASTNAIVTKVTSYSNQNQSGRVQLPHQFNRHAPESTHISTDINVMDNVSKTHSSTTVKIKKS